MYKVLLLERSSHSALLNSQINILNQHSIPFIALVSPELLLKSPEIAHATSENSLILSNQFDSFEIIHDYPAIELIVVNTFDHLPSTFIDSLLCDRQLYVYIHNCNNFSAYLGRFPLYNLLSVFIDSLFSHSFFKCARSSVFFILRYRARRRLLFYKHTSYLVMHNNLEMFLCHHLRIPKEKVFLVPFSTLSSPCLPLPIHNNRKCFRIVTFGNIDFSRRNYVDGFQLFTNIKNSGLNVEWVILGQYSNVNSQIKLAELCQNFDLQPLVIGGMSRVSIEQASNVILNSDFLLPLHFKCVRVGCFFEYFSTTKASGVEFDSLAFAKYSLLRDWYQPHRNLESLSILYSTIDSLSSYLINFYASKISSSINLSHGIPCINSELENQFVAAICSSLLK